MVLLKFLDSKFLESVGIKVEINHLLHADFSRVSLSSGHGRLARLERSLLKLERSLVPRDIPTAPKPSSFLVGIGSPKLLILKTVPNLLQQFWSCFSELARSSMKHRPCFRVKFRLLKWGVFSRWSFRSNFAWSSIETMTIAKTHPSFRTRKTLFLVLSYSLYIVHGYLYFQNMKISLMKKANILYGPSTKTRDWPLEFLPSLLDR